MKSFFIFIGGFLSGVFVMFYLLRSNSALSEPNDGLVGLTMFPEKGECVPAKTELQVLQVVEPNMALAETGNYADRILVLLINYEGKSYYDDQKIKIPAKKCAKQVGTYQYRTRMGIDKTVPAVIIE